MSRRIEFEATDEALRALDRLGLRWGDKTRTRIIEKAIFTAESALLHTEAHPTWQPPAFEGNRYYWRQRGR